MNEKIELTPVMEKFILHWGEMGSRWGLSRSVAQIYALLYLAPRPLNAEEISEILSVARSNVSTSLKELQSWELVRVVNVLNDRRDYFQSLTEVWTIFQTILEQRKRRELAPTLAALDECVQESRTGSSTDRHVEARIEQMMAFLQTLLAWHEQVKQIPQPVATKLLKMGSAIQKLAS